VAEALLETDGLTRRFGALAAVDGVTLRVERGTVHAIIGPNGAGKSTLLNLLSGELRATSGRVRFRGEDVTRAPPDVLSRMGIGRSYQTANVFPELTCAECVWLAAYSKMGDTSQMGDTIKTWCPLRYSARSLFRRFRDDAEAAGRGEEALRACGLSGRLLSRAAELSYGEQRQLEVAMMLATDPELLLVDEPLAGLGHDEGRMVLALLREVAERRTLVLIEHDMDAVFAVAHTVTVLVNGRVLESGPPAAIRESPRVREAYLGEEEP
jgi:branched-chain amino acid transport system ATP-binding protein